MSPKNRYGTLKRLWEAGSLEVHRGIRVLLEGPADPVEVTAPEEVGPTNVELELDLAVLELKAETCRRISDAMWRVEQGTFGCCESCGEQIPPARLKALPFANRCRGCQEREEAAAQGGRAGLTALIAMPSAQAG
jgi:RNA polymerase-binding transcription factor DksA